MTTEKHNKELQGWSVGATGIATPASGLALGRYVGFLASGSAPLAGDFRVGDFATTPTGGIVCTVAGNPGTWVSFSTTDTDPAAATTVVGPDNFGAAAAVGTSTSYARADHDHGLPALGASPSAALHNEKSNANPTDTLAVSLAGQAAGNVAIALVAGQMGGGEPPNSTITAPAGWTQQTFVTFNSGAGTVIAGIYTFTCTGSDGTQTFTLATNNGSGIAGCQLVVRVYQNVGSVQFAGNATAVNTTTFPAYPSFTTDSTDELAVTMAVQGGHHDGTFTQASGLTTQYDSNVTDPTLALRTVVADETILASGAAFNPGAPTLSGATNSNLVVMTIGLHAASSPPPAPLLGITQYAPGTPTSYSVSSSTFTALDTTNLTVSFVAPTSGVVLLRLSGQSHVNNGSHNYYWFPVTHGGTTLVSGAVLTQVSVQQGVNGVLCPVSVVQRIAGLTAGQTFQWDWAHAISAASGMTGALFLGGSTTVNDTSNLGPAVMEVWSAK